MFEFKLPDVGEGMHEGEIVRWFIKEGDVVNIDEPIVEVQTDKVTVELPSPVSGVVEQIRVQDGAIVGVGTTLLTITTKEPVNELPAPKIQESEKGLLKVAEFPKQSEAPRIVATPHVRKLAREMGIDIEKIQGTGRMGRVSEEDLKHFMACINQPAYSSQDNAVLRRATNEVSFPIGLEERIPLRGIRKKIAEHMVKSVSIIPHVTHVDEIEVDALRALRERVKPYAENRQIKLTFLPFFVKAIVFALKEFPMFNASIDDNSGEIVLKHYYNIGIATDTKDGLVVPVVRSADSKSVLQLAKEISGLANAAQAGKLTLEDITGGTFTITNAGPLGGLYATPIIHHPEVAILGLHKMEHRNVVRDWESVIRVMMNISLSFDHRLIDGALAIRFTNRIKELMEVPEKLFLEMI